MLTGELPLGRFAPPSRKVQIDVRLDEVVLRALEKEPQHRYQHASVLKTEVETIVTTPPQNSARVSPAIPPLPQAETPVANVTQWVARILGVLGFLFILMFIMAEGFPAFWQQPPAVQVELAGTVLMLIGLLLGWKHEGWGAALIVAGWLVFFIIERGRPPWLFTAFLVVATLYAYGWWQKRLMWRRAAGKPVDGAISPNQPLRFGRIRRIVAGVIGTAVLIAFLAGYYCYFIKSDYVGQTNFPRGDSIVITSVQRSRSRMLVKGHYNLVSHDNALLALYCTSTNRALVPEEPTQRMQISKGRADFELSRSHLYPGLHHVTMYANGEAFAGVYFGNKDEALRESKLDLGYYQTRSNATASAFQYGLASERNPAVITAETIRNEVGRQLREGGAAYDDLQVTVAEPRDSDTSVAKRKASADQVAVEDLALQMLVAIREKDDDALRALATDRITDWPDALPQFAIELRERFRRLTGEPFDMRESESIVENDLAAAKCTGPEKLGGKYLVLFFVKTKNGWRNYSLRSSLPDILLAQHFAKFKTEIEKGPSPSPHHETNGR